MELERWREVGVGRRDFLAPERWAVEVRRTGGGAWEEEEIVRLGGDSQVVAARRARGDEGGRCSSPVWPQMLPKFGAGLERNGLSGGSGSDRGLGVALGAVFGPVMYV
jgi:hypothetical protein